MKTPRTLLGEFWNRSELQSPNIPDSDRAYMQRQNRNGCRGTPQPFFQII